MESWRHRQQGKPCRQVENSRCVAYVHYDSSSHDRAMTYSVTLTQCIYAVKADHALHRITQRVSMRCTRDAIQNDVNHVKHVYITPISSVVGVCL